MFLHGAEWIKDRTTDEALPCDDCGSLVEQGLTCLDGGDWLCLECCPRCSGTGKLEEESLLGPAGISRKLPCDLCA